MKCIAVIDCASSSQMYVDDIINMGRTPILIYNYMDKAHAAAWSANIDNTIKSIGDKAEIIRLEKDDDENSVLEKLKNHDIELVLPGTDSGVRLADKLSKALGLKGNDPATSGSRVNKEGMIEALSKAGIRHIMTVHARCVDDVREFWNTHCSGKAVMKFSESAGTVGLKICSTLDECTIYFEQMKNMFTMTGRSGDGILMQEFIGGTEYIVNSISVDGKHKITDIWKYHKLIQDDGILVYDYCILVDRLGPGMQELVDYDYKVLDAVKFENGFCHTEIKVDAKGPVLIETNPRPMGGNLSKEYLDEIFGSHMTDNVLKSLLEPSFFTGYKKTPYLPRKSSMLKFAIVPKDIKADLEPFFDAIRHLDSFREIVYFGKTGMQEYARTIDLETSPFFVRLTNQDYGALMRDYELVRTIEEMYLELEFTTMDSIPASATCTELV